MTDELLPALPEHPAGKFESWSSEEASVIRAYAREAIRLAQGCRIGPFFARGVSNDWKGGGRTGIYFDGDFDVELMRRYYLTPAPPAGEVA